LLKQTWSFEMKSIGSIRPGWAAVAMAMTLVVGLASPSFEARGTPTSPALLLTDAETEEGESGTMLRVQGSYPYSDLIHQPYPLQLFVREVQNGTRFVCFSVPWGVMEGESAIFADGLDEAEVEQISTLSTPSPDGRIVKVSPQYISVHLPADFPPGPAEAQLFVMYQGLPVFSNPLRFVIEGEEEAAQ
jgi:hypothetical protein